MSPTKLSTRAQPKRARRASNATNASKKSTSVTTNRLLSLSEAAQLIDKSVPLSSLPTHSAETTKKDKKVLKMYESVTGTTKVRRKGITLFLLAVIERQKHLKNNLQEITVSKFKARGYRDGKARLMSLNTFRCCYVAVLRRLYKAQKPNKDGWSGRVNRDVRKIDNLAKTILGVSIDTKAIGVEETSLLIAAMGQGARYFFSHACLMSALLETGRRVNCFRKRAFKHIKEIKEITDPAKRHDPRARLIEVVFARYKDKGEGVGEDGAHDIHLRGSLFFNDGFVDSIYYLNRRCVQDFGLPLFDIESGRTILDHIAADPELKFVLHESLFEVNAERAYELFRRGQNNLNIDPTLHVMRPHGTRKGLYSAGVAAMESGELTQAHLDGLRSQLGHCPFSRSGREHYLGSDYLSGLNYGALFSPNPHVRALGVHIRSKTLEEKWKLKEPVRILWKDNPLNFQLVEDLVTERICQKDAKKNAKGALPRFYKKPSKARVDRKIAKLLLGFAASHCPECAAMNDTDKAHHAKLVVIKTLSSYLSRDQMIQFIDRMLLSKKIKP
jgi:hypothetical protein